MPASILYKLQPSKSEFLKGIGDFEIMNNLANFLQTASYKAQHRTRRPLKALRDSLALL